MQGIFKNGNQLIVNGADSDERILIDNFYESMQNPQNTLKVDQVLDINGDADGLMFSVKNNILPDIVTFPHDKVTVKKGESTSVQIQTKPVECACFVTSNNVSVATAYSGTAFSTVVIEGVDVGITQITVILQALGYNQVVYTLDVEVVQGE